MEANFFRLLALEIAQVLKGARIQKIYHPDSNLFTFELHLARPLELNGRSCKYLIFKASSQGLLFFSGHKPQNPQAASALTMWWRKRLSGRVICSCLADWPKRKLYLELGPGPGVLCLDLVKGLELLDEMPRQEFPEPNWPGLKEILENKDIHAIYPQISPQLRTCLSRMSGAEAEVCLDGLKRGDFNEIRLVKGAQFDEPLPYACPGRESGERFASALVAAAQNGERRLFSALRREEEAVLSSEARLSAKRAARRLARLEEDERRMCSLADRQSEAEALAVSLHLLPKTAGLSRLELEHPEAGRLDIELDPSLTPSANLERLFKLAAKGRRGLKHVARLREELALGGQSKPKARDKPEQTQESSGKYKGLNVRCFRSQSGFKMLRGKNAKANHELLSRAASPFDYWFHAKDCPGAHVILKRDHPGQAVDELAFEQAAQLAALASGLSGERNAQVICAEVREVRKIKGAALGQVVVDKVLKIITVTPSPELESRLLEA